MDKMDFSGSPAIGLMCFVTDEFALVGANLRFDAKKLKKALGVEIHRIKVAGTNLVGLLLNGSKKKIYAPRIIFEHELEELKENFNVSVLETKHTALGNNLIFGKKILANPEMEKSVIKELKAKTLTVGGNSIIGSCAALNDKSMIVTPDASATEIEALKKDLNLRIGVGTVNFGTKMVGSGILINNKGLLAGSSTSGPELMRLQEIFNL